MGQAAIARACNPLIVHLPVAEILLAAGAAAVGAAGMVQGRGEGGVLPAAWCGVRCAVRCVGCWRAQLLPPLPCCKKNDETYSCLGVEPKPRPGWSLGQHRPRQLTKLQLILSSYQGPGLYRTSASRLNIMMQV